MSCSEAAGKKQDVECKRKVLFVAIDTPRKSRSEKGKSSEQLTVPEVSVPVIIDSDSTGALIWTLGEKAGEKCGGCDWPAPKSSAVLANYSHRISHRLFHSGHLGSN